MDRRAFLAVGATALLAGCDANGDDTPTPTESNPDETDAPGGDTPDDGGGTITPGGDFDAAVTFQSCTEFTVEAEEYTTVFAVIAGGENSEWNEGYSGSESFEASGPVNTVVVYSGEGSYEAPNPEASECREQAEG
jgi:hypothetical protein